jgi:tetratricopeptide (TPR) repeat protein
MLAMLGNVYIEQRRFAEAGKTLDHALEIYDAGRITGPMDRIKLLHSRALLQIRQRQWPQAEEDLRTAISTADRDTLLDAVELNGLLAGYAFVLRKNHKTREARSVERRAAALPNHGWNNAVVDVSDLLPRR